MLHARVLLARLHSPVPPSVLASREGCLCDQQLEGRESGRGLLALEFDHLLRRREIELHAVPAGSPAREHLQARGWPFGDRTRCCAAGSG